jgi:hypothetical protein
MIAARFRLPVGLAAGAALTLGAQLAAGQVAGGFRQPIPNTPAERLNAAVQQLGIGRCAPVFAQAGQFLFENATAQFVVQPLGPDVNRWPTAVTIEGAYPLAAKPGAAAAPTQQTRLTTLIVAPAGSCSGLYNQVIYWPEPCAGLKTRVFGSYTNERPLLARVRQSEANPGLQLYLMPAGANGCVSVKKELIG